MNDQFWGWLAGFWEADGSLGKPGLRITQKSPIPLWKIQQVCGGVVVADKKVWHNGRLYYVWRVTNSPDIRAILMKMRPHLRFRLMQVNRYLDETPKRIYKRQVIVERKF